MSTDRHEVIDRLTLVARPIILGRFRPDSCIASTAIAIDVLDYFGFRAKPLPVKLGVYNPLAWQALQAGVEPDWEAGAWGVGVGFKEDLAEVGRADAYIRQSPNGVDGHLVALVEDEVIVDLSLDQASRPAKGINVGPFFGTIRPENVAGFMEGGEGLVFSDHEGTRCCYWLIEDQFWKDAPDWTDRTRRKDLVGRIIRQVRQGLPEQSLG